MEIREHQVSKTAVPVIAGLPNRFYTMLVCHWEIL